MPNFPIQANNSNADEQHQHQGTPWFDLPHPNRVDRWHLAGNRENVTSSLHRDVENGENIVALVILQDCNICGQYYRYFWWLKDNSRRFCDITSAWVLNTNEGVTELSQGQTVTVCGQYRFKVSPKNCTECYKILERVC